MILSFTCSNVSKFDSFCEILQCHKWRLERNLERVCLNQSNELKLYYNSKSENYNEILKLADFMCMKIKKPLFYYNYN